jgi:pimeloyl-ACP methyl ester carboxylesterase
MVCVHGHCLDHTTFQRFVDRIAGRWGPPLRVGTYDHRGHGRSGSADVSTYTIAQLARDLAAVLRAVAPAGPVVLVGHSMGGMTMLRYVREHPDDVGNRIVAVALIASSAGDLPAHGLSRTLRSPIIPWFTASAKACPSVLHGMRQVMCSVVPPLLRTPGLRSSPAGR